MRTIPFRNLLSMAVLLSPPGRSARSQYGASKARACGLAVFLCLVASQAWGQLTVQPTEGNSLGMVTAPEAGKWIVVTPDFLPVQFSILEAGKVCVIQGKPGVYGVFFFPPNDAQPLVQRVVLGGGTTPVDPPPTPAGQYQVMFFVTAEQRDNLPRDQRAIFTSLSDREWLAAQGHVLLEVLDPTRASGSSSDSYAPWVKAAEGKALPAVGLAPKGGGAIVVHPMPANSAEFRRLVSGKAVR